MQYAYNRANLQPVPWHTDRRPRTCPGTPEVTHTTRINEWPGQARPPRAEIIRVPLTTEAAAPCLRFPGAGAACRRSGPQRSPAAAARTPTPRVVVCPSKGPLSRPPAETLTPTPPLQG